MNRSILVWVGLLCFAAPGALAAQRQKVNNPHGKLSQPCASCHSASGWTPAHVTSAFDHAKTSGFPLAGAHATVACKSCHTTLTFRGAPHACASCHTDPHRGELGAGCNRCHTPTSFVDQSQMMRAHQVTRFPLTGSHLSVACESCHAQASSGKMTFVALSTGCNDCHLRDYLATKNPDHSAGGYSHACEGCHATVTWQGATFDHRATRFPLTGAHLAISCTQCHGSGTTGPLPTACVSCHQADYDNAQTPNHRQAQYSTDCTSCHTTVAWAGAKFDHNATAFPLTGAHVQATCAMCHGDGVYKGKPTTCVSCHLTDYNNTQNPNHQQAQYSTDCTVCHTTATWVGATFDHNATAFPLTGAHLQATCVQCHGDGVYKGKSTACVSCHLTEYNNTQNPNHQQAQYSTDCTACHKTTTWVGATFDHNNTAFPLTGAHVQATCTQCHGDGVYKGKSTACVSCHLTDYNNSVDPNHQLAQLSTDCASCHTTTVWSSGKFTSHDAQYFPIYSGSHRGRWNSCSSCHTNPSDYRQFDCKSCHGDKHHKGYTNAQCYSCHPDGRH